MLPTTNNRGCCVRSRFLPKAARPPTDAAAFAAGPPQLAQRGVEVLRASMCLTLDELYSEMEFALQEDGGRCPWPLIRLLAANAPFLAVSQRGCPVFIRVYKRVDAERKEVLVSHLLPQFAALAKDSYANYMVQCAIEHTDRTTAAQYVVQFFAGHLLQMSCDRFASNVVEKVVRVCGGVPAVRRLVLDELVYNPAALKELVSDGYGNFVVQSVVSTVAGLSELGIVARVFELPGVDLSFATNILAKVNMRRRDVTASLMPARRPSLRQPPHQPQPVASSLAARTAAHRDAASPSTSAAMSQHDAPVVFVGVRPLGRGRYRFDPYRVALSEVDVEDTALLFRPQQLSSGSKHSDSDGQRSLGQWG
ncbi:putative pumilio protein [Leptomonas pyrrhocoris]|uniref:Putative pumilio protein n=1 Tax=Leptomonas pyrrhocoris TaxID=157538 RepID=A0A0N0VDG9_LEPPY|nr:putative pumilio protein [Leptomonas pyrrhocoris]XP_015653671.1 putative pumilio protein [Leptomonas pyrrhocoris]KPA75231.1 putative pumilio protein [Leptomonas pyrrhocoris]KPA75232.1 putative pumilio protein [Leptomonas pyrrhocoris]|eukprot:XP_015653670.1 putative pumilio protein [Leptomonas pyrrhocoris]